MQSWQENTKYHMQDRDVNDASSREKLVFTEEAIFGSQVLTIQKLSLK